MCACSGFTPSRLEIFRSLFFHGPWAKIALYFRPLFFRSPRRFLSDDTAPHPSRKENIEPPPSAGSLPNPSLIFSPRSSDSHRVEPVLRLFPWTRALFTFPRPGLCVFFFFSVPDHMDFTPPAVRSPPPRPYPSCPFRRRR